MIEGRRVIALTPARGGSKSVPYKNLHPLGGKPLLAWPIATARADPVDRSRHRVDRRRSDRASSARRSAPRSISDRPSSRAIPRLWPIPSATCGARLRGEGETASILVLLEATSPFRTPEIIERCLRRMVDENLDSIATFHEAEINPERTWRIEAGNPEPFIRGAIPWKPRQLLTPAYQLNAAVYAFVPDALPADSPSILFGRMGAEMVPADSVIDIDTLKDFAYANALLQS